jgi:hypothetical protein
LVEVVESRARSSFIDGDRAPNKAYKHLHHYWIFLDETGFYELFAESASAKMVIDALSLDDTRGWADLKHAYGSAGDIPHLMQQLLALSASSGRDEPWFSPWSALAHQGDVYSASFAAVPHEATFDAVQAHLRAQSEGDAGARRERPNPPYRHLFLRRL